MRLLEGGLATHQHHLQGGRRDDVKKRQVPNVTAVIGCTVLRVLSFSLPLLLCCG